MKHRVHITTLLVLALSLYAMSQGFGGHSGKGGHSGSGGGTTAATGATFISAAQNQSATAASIAVSSISIPSGSIIVIYTIDSFGANITNPTDSNSDTPSCGSIASDSNGNGGQLCLMKAGATITTVTCTSSSASFNIACIVAWYSPGSLTVALDQSAGQAQNNISAWSSGTTSTLSGSSDLFVGSWSSANTSITSSGDDGTVRIKCSTFGTPQFSCELEDRNISGTTGQAASGTWSPTTFGEAFAMAVK